MATQETPVRRPNRNLMPLAAAVPLTTALYAAVFIAPWPPQAGPTLALCRRYLSHPVEFFEVLLFFGALGVLLTRFLNNRVERQALATEIVPPWNGQAGPVSQATELKKRILTVPERLRETFLVRRIEAVLDYLTNRRSADHLDDQLRALADTDALTVDNSNALVKFITWAIPILGFLGTVLGITEAVSGVTPEKLESSLSQVTDGLAVAFDTTALALALTMITMFCSFLLDRAEGSSLSAVDQYVEDQLAHRFERALTPDGAAAAALEQLVQRQADLWARTFTEADRQRGEVEGRLQERWTKGIESATERTLQQHTERLGQLETRTHGQLAALLDAIGTLAKQTTTHAEALARLQDGETQLLRAQQILNQNLAAVTASGQFEEAVHSLSAAVHLLTAKTSGPRKAA